VSGLTPPPGKPRPSTLAGVAPVRLLLVEDDAGDQLAITRAITRKRLPYQLTIATTVAEARRLLASQPFDVLVTDYRLPDGTGMDVADAAGTNLPWIIMTGDGDEGVAVSALRRGAHDYLVKTLDQAHVEVLPFSIEAATRLRLAEGRSEMLALALAGIRDAVCITSAEGIIVYANAAFERTYRLGDSVGRQEGDLVSGGLASVEELAPGGWSGEAVHLRGDGSEFPAWLSRSTLLDNAGRVMARVSVVRDMTEHRRAADELKRANEELERSRRSLEELAARDDLTGLLNRRELTRLFTEEAARAKRVARPLSLLLIDIDHFKRINDRHGHPAGDEVIRHLARVLQRTLRLVDRAARIGGEEFAILLPETDSHGALAVAERLRALVANGVCAVVDGHGARGEVSFTVSIGVSSAASAAITLAELLASADRGLYQAKAEGRNRVVKSP
jgi:two-component system cell cycle response regulator